MSDFAGALWVRGEETIQALPALSGSTIEIGDLLKISGSTVERVGATTDNLIFIGVAKEAHYSTEGQKLISVAIRNGRAVYKIGLDAAATVAPGANLQMYTTTPHQVLTPSDTDAVAMAAQAVTSGLSLEVIFSLPNKTGGPRLVGDAS